VIENNIKVQRKAVSNGFELIENFIFALRETLNKPIRFSPAVSN
jgi:hypothetical protein